MSSSKFSQRLWQILVVGTVFLGGGVCDFFHLLQLYHVCHHLIDAPLLANIPREHLSMMAGMSSNALATETGL